MSRKFSSRAWKEVSHYASAKGVSIREKRPDNRALEGFPLLTFDFVGVGILDCSDELR